MRMWATRDYALQLAKGLEIHGWLATYPVEDFIRALFKMEKEEFDQLLANYYRDHDPFQQELPLNATNDTAADDRSQENPVLRGTPCDESRVQVPEPPRA